MIIRKHMREFWSINKLIFFGVLGIIFSCTPKSTYQKTVDKELSSGERYDSLFFDMHLGMNAKAFYDRCWELNKEGIIMEGGTNSTVLYNLEGLSDDVAMEFYPIIKDEKVQSMTGFFHFRKWAPWNQQFYADKLILEIKEMLEEWYGPGFFEVPSPGRGLAYAHIKGNRRIVLYYLRDERVEMLITDLTNDDGILTMDES